MNEFEKFYSETRNFSDNARKKLAKDKVSLLTKEYAKESDKHKKELLVRRIIKWAKIAGIGTIKLAGKTIKVTLSIAAILALLGLVGVGPIAYDYANSHGVIDKLKAGYYNQTGDKVNAIKHSLKGAFKESINGPAELPHISIEKVGHTSIFSEVKFYSIKFDKDTRTFGAKLERVKQLGKTTAKIAGGIVGGTLALAAGNEIHKALIDKDKDKA
jgi:hypothetical protein